MKKSEVTIPGFYTAKVSGQIVTVKVYAIHRLGGWHAINMATGREIRIKTAARLRSRVTEARP